MSRRGLLACATALLGACGGEAADRTVRIAAAANNAKAFEEVGSAFTAKTGIHATFTFQASGMLERQIEAGTAYFVFASANKELADKAVASGKCDRASEIAFARGRLVAWIPKGGRAPTALADLAGPTYRQIAIANPETAPYGKAAQQTLQKAGLWDQVKAKLVVGENIEATMQLAVDRKVDVALVAQSLAVVEGGGQSLAIDPALHDPIDQYLVTCGAGPELARAQAFVAFLASPDGREIMTRYGFSLPP